MPKKYIAISEVTRFIQELRSAYPESVFPSPENGGEGPAAHYASGARVACDVLLARLPSVAVEAVEVEDSPKKK